MLLDDPHLTGVGPNRVRRLAGCWTGRRKRKAKQPHANRQLTTEGSRKDGGSKAT